MTIFPGNLLISAPSLEDANFDKVVIWIAEYNEKGALGFVINRPFPRRLNELVEFNQCIPFPLYDGGPVEREALFCIHRRPDLVAGSTRLFETVYMGGDFKKVVAYLNDKTLQENEVKLFIGYAGWDPLQLEAEIAEGSWLLMDAAVPLVFSHPASTLWQELFDRRR